MMSMLKGVFSLLALGGVAAAQGLLNQTLGYLEGTPGLNNTYDYVVVGAGTAVSAKSVD